MYTNFVNKNVMLVVLVVFFVVVVASFFLRLKKKKKIQKRRQRVQVVRTLGLQFVGPEFKARSDR